MLETRILGADAVDEAARLLAGGALVAFPTETVYGLGGDARNGRAVAEIFAAKGRPSFNPLIVHVGNPTAARALAVFSDMALRLAAAFWPGPLTLVLPLADDSPLSPLVSAGLPSVALRVPAHPLARALLERFGGPVAAPSANPSGRVSPTRAEHVQAGLSGRIAAILDGGPCKVGLESTIVGLTGEPTLLRPGGVAAEDIEAVIGRPLALPRAPDADGGTPRPNSPGQLASHYAPAAALRTGAERPRADEVYLAFGESRGTGAATVLNLSPAGDLTEAATNLFHLLREADRLAGPCGAIAVAPIPEAGLGRAINDRLRRAAAPR